MTVMDLLSFMEVAFHTLLVLKKKKKKIYIHEHSNRSHNRGHGRGHRPFFSLIFDFGNLILTLSAFSSYHGYVFVPLVATE